MIIKTKRKTSNRLNDNNLIKKHLSIQFSLDGFSFCIYEPEIKTFLAYSKYVFDHKINTPEKLLKAIQQIFLKDTELQHDFNSILAIHDNELITFVPNAFFDKDNLKEYLKYNNKVLATDFFSYDTIKNQEMKAVFIPYMNINNFLFDRFGSFDYRHASAILVETLLEDYASKEVQVFVRLSDNFYKLIITKNRQLLFFNTFEFHTPEDFMYYLLFTLEQLEINTNTQKILFLGEVDKHQKLMELSKKYLNQVSLLEPKLIETETNLNSIVLREDFELFHSL